ncbi:MAG TPA: carboxylesterase family protein [Steroidobacteraceae bacterium]|nr:carboxylesterase family protein [Steroidobacteraceae bacterium]
MVRSRSGVVLGGRAGGARHWLGIPYATAERFAPPSPPDTWSKPRNVVVFGPECPQYFGSFASKKKIDSREVSERCLVLNVWAPDSLDPIPRPVLVWIHGGAFMAGTGNLYDGAELAARGDIIVVTINYRLGILGFVNLGDALELPELPSNLGMRDQIAALEWVRDNIVAFGGDPERVTIAGESAGSIAISLLMHCPHAQPLFHRVIMQSGAISLPHSLATSRRIAQRYVEVLRLQPRNLERLRSIDIRTLLEAQAKVHKLEPGSVPGAPWFDGELFPSSLAAARASPTPAIPLLAGFNREEIRTFEIFRGPPILPMTHTDNERLIREQLPADRADGLLKLYPNTKHDTRALATDLCFAMPTLHFAERHATRNTTWFYRFDYSHPLLGAAHGLELAFLWKFRGIAGLLMRGGLFTAKRRALADRMQQQWAHFVKHGRPLDDWPTYSAQRRSVRLFNLVDATVEDPDAPRRIAWAGADVSTTGVSQ